MKIKSHIFFFLSCLACLNAFAQSSIQFIENKGQWDSRVKYMGTVPGGAFFIHKDGFTVLQHHPEDLQHMQELIHGHGNSNKKHHQKEDHQKNHKPKEKDKLRSHAYRVVFVNGNENATIIADKPITTYNNYFIGNDPSKWAANCKIYQGITIQNIYPNVDARYYSENGFLKYDLIVKPGGDISNIKLKYDGVDKLEVKDKQLVVKTSIGDIKELDPYTYQFTEKGKRQVGAKYSVKGNMVNFAISSYDKTSTLVIDPTMIFASFTGSTADNWGFTATYGPDGSFYGGGIVGGAGFPVSNGAFQNTFGGVPWDIAIMKLTSDGSSRMYATYIGGSSNEQPHSLVVDAEGNLIIAGRTNSANYPTTGANGMIGTGGGYEIVVTKLNPTGTALIGSKKIGGTGDDGVNINSNRFRSSLQYNYGDDGRSEVIVDGAGNIYVASCTQSSNFPVVGGFQATSGGTQDGVVLKFPPDVSNLSFSTHIGGSGNDAAYVLALHPTNSNIYVAGGTESTNFPGTDATSLHSTSRGGVDGFVAIINNNGSQLIRSTYLGTPGIDQVYGVQFDRNNFPYVMGQTTGSWPVQNAQWSQSGGKQFIAKLQENLSSYVYSTVFGTNSAEPNISPVAFLVDRCENVYVSGWGGPIDMGNFSLAGTSGLTTVNPLQPSTDGKDLYFFVLRRNATAQLYGDFYGQNGGFTDHVDGGTSRFDANGVIYQAICANCSSPGVPYPTTPGAYAETNGSANCNLAMVKIALNLSGIQSGVQSAINGVVRDSAGCVPLTVDFKDTLQNGTSYEWNFGDGSPQITTTTPNASHTYTVVGTYNVMLVAIDPNSCNIRDTSYMSIRVGELEALPAFTQSRLEPCTEFKYRFDNTSVAPAVRPFSNNSFIWDFGDGSPRVTAGAGSVTKTFASPGTYKVRLYIVDTGYCNAPDSAEVTLRVAAAVKAKFNTPPPGCVPYEVSFTNTSDGGTEFIWRFGDGNTSTEANPVHTYTAEGTYTVTLVAIDSSTCNKIDSTTVTMRVHGKPTALFNVASPQPPPVNTPVVLTNASSANAINFKWLFGDGDSLITASRQPLEHEFNATKTYDVTLIAYTQNGCTDTFRRQVTSVVEPAVDVPNAFTPLSGSVNSIVMVRGFAIGKMKFVIWNRWGQKVFETENRKEGWDGKFRGVLQPMDVYVYTLEVEFTDGTKATKKGDITLIR